MYRNDRPPLPDWIADAYETLGSEINAHEGGLSIDQAQQLLANEGFVEGDAEYALTRVLNRGYLYTVDDDLFVTALLNPQRATGFIV